MPRRKQQRCVHTFTFLTSPKDSKRRPKPHQARDANGASWLQAGMAKQGYAKGEDIFNVPPLPVPEDAVGAVPDNSIDTSFVRAWDVLQLTTRPPLDDSHRKKVHKAGTTVETDVLTTIRPFFGFCSRLHVELALKLRDSIKPGFEDRMEMMFSERSFAPYTKLRAGPRRKWRKAGHDGATAAFLLRLERAWAGGPGLLAAWGMDGQMTLVWCYRLAHDFAHLLEKPGFTVVEIVPTKGRERLTDLRCTKEWQVTPILTWEPKQRRKHR